MKLTIIHIADLHFTSFDEIYFRTVWRALLDDVKQQMKSGSIPSLVCVAGDLVDKGENSYGKIDELLFSPLRDTLQLTADDFYFVPGNHDIDRKQISQAFETGLDKTLVNQKAFRQFCLSTKKGTPDCDSIERKFHQYNGFLKKFGRKNLRHESIFADVYETTYNGIKVGIVGINSSWRCSQFADDAKRLVIGENIIVEAAYLISKCDFRICLCHHPLEMLADWDCKPVRQAIAKNFNILLNGHVHESDVIETKQILGSLIVSTTGCLNESEHFSSYTLITLDFNSDNVTFDFRKWYKDREVFDQDTSKAPNGRVVFQGIKSTPSNTASALTVAVVRSRLQTQKQSKELICPIEGIDDVELEDVFVEPLLTNKSGFDRDTEDRKTLHLNDILQSKENYFFAGRPEFGKTTLIKYSRDYILKHDKHFDGNIPVLLNFNDISGNTVKNLTRQMARILGQTEDQTIAFATAGQLTFLVDDFNDRQNLEHEKKVKIIRELYRSYPKCRYVFSTTEHLSPNLQHELLTLASAFQAQIAYFGSLNTAKIRQLLLKWKQKQDFDVDAMLTQILYYFQHCQIPVTPLAVVLFLGVLFNERKERKIRNEAVLIENYLETILEKVNPLKSNEEQDFRDKEDFLAAIAWHLAEANKTTIELLDLEKLKIEYYEQRDEDLPRSSFFDTFFEKGILVRDEGVVYFSRRLWFNFFLAKALDWNKDTLINFLNRDDVLKYSKALAYKAGITRKEVELLKWVDERAMKGAQPIIDKYFSLELKETGHNAPFTQLSESIAKELKEKNTDESVDARRDSTYLNYDEDKSSLEDEQMEQFDDLITLQSDILRNTTHIKVTEKRQFIQNNVSCYVAMMWGGLEMFRETIQKSDEEELFKLFFSGRKDATLRQKLKVVIEHAQRVVHFVVPLSVLVYMDEHLGTPKLAKSFRKLAENATSPTKKLFYYLLFFAQSPKEGVRELKKLITTDSCTTEDYIICGYLRWYCHQNKIEEHVLDRIVAIFDEVRKKYAQQLKQDIPFLRDTFRTDVKRDLRLKRVS